MQLVVIPHRFTLRSRFILLCTRPDHELPGWSSRQFCVWLRLFAVVESDEAFSELSWAVASLCRTATESAAANKLQFFLSPNSAVSRAENVRFGAFPTPRKHVYFRFSHKMPLPIHLRRSSIPNNRSSPSLSLSDLCLDTMKANFAVRSFVFLFVNFTAVIS